MCACQLSDPCLSSKLYCVHREMVGGCSEMARELKWNSIFLPTLQRFMKPVVLFSLALSLLYVSVIVKLSCVKYCDSFIILEKLCCCDVFLLVQFATS